MNAVRRDEELDNLHSIYVDQWDWGRVITADQRTLEFCRRLYGILWMRSARHLTSCAGSFLN